MSDVREDQAQISEVLVRYATGIDRRDWELFRTCWTDDVDADYGQIGRIRGADELTRRMAEMHEGLGDTYHRVTNFTIEVDGDRATARSYVHAVLMVSKDDPNGWIDVIGHYDDVFVRTPEGWRISRRRTHIARYLTGSSARLDPSGSAAQAAS